jgi:hypothetical protein
MAQSERECGWEKVYSNICEEYGNGTKLLNGINLNGKYARLY